MTSLHRGRAQVWAAVAIALLGLTACGHSTVGAGEACTRSAQCESGLVCVEGACSDDLSPLEDPSRVPMLTPPEVDAAVAVDAAAPDAAPTAGAGGAPPSDAAMPTMDAALPPTDAAMPAMDAAAPDAAGG